MKNTELQPEKRYQATPLSRNRSPFFFMGVERKSCPSNYGALEDGTLTVWPFDFDRIVWIDGKLVGYNDNDDSPYEITESDVDASRKAAIAAAHLAKEKIQAAQTLLYEACQIISPLGGWSDLHQAVGDHADLTKALWHKLDRAKPPMYHDYR